MGDPPPPNVLEHTGTNCTESVHCRLLPWENPRPISQGGAFFGSRGWSSQLGSGKRIQIVVSQVKGSVGTGEKSERGARTESRSPVKMPFVWVYANFRFR